jgi:hypothetical protein
MKRSVTPNANAADAQETQTTMGCEFSPNTNWVIRKMPAAKKTSPRSILCRFVSSNLWFDIVAGFFFSLGRFGQYRFYFRPLLAEQ